MRARAVLHADIEPHRAVERRFLHGEQMRQFRVKAFGVFVAAEITVLPPPFGNRAGDAVNQLLHALLALRRIERAVKIFLRDDIRGGLRPKRRDFHVGLLENYLAAYVRQAGDAAFPLNFFERMNAGDSVITPDGHALAPARRLFRRRRLVLRLIMPGGRAFQLFDIIHNALTPSHELRRSDSSPSDTAAGC